MWVCHSNVHLQSASGILCRIKSSAARVKNSFFKRLKLKQVYIVLFSRNQNENVEWMSTNVFTFYFFSSDSIRIEGNCTPPQSV